MELGNFVNSYSKLQQWSELMLTSGMAIEQNERKELLNVLTLRQCVPCTLYWEMVEHLLVNHLPISRKAGIFFYYLKKLTFISLFHKQLQNFSLCFYFGFVFYFFKWLSKCSSKISKLCSWKHRTTGLGLGHSMAEEAIHNYSVRIVKSH